MSSIYLKHVSITDIFPHIRDIFENIYVEHL